MANKARRRCKPMRGAPLRERYEAKVDRSAGPDACHPWVAGRSIKNYGVIASDHRVADTAHRVGYRLYVGPIPAGATIDHTCHNRDKSCPGGNSCEHRACQNPAHWEAVTAGENTRRGKSFSSLNAVKTHCPAGHEYTPDNVYPALLAKKGRRACVTCARDKARERYANGGAERQRLNRKRAAGDRVT